MPRETEIRIPMISKTDRNGDEYWVTEKLGFDCTINLNDWIGLAFIPPEGQDHGEMILKPRRKELNLPQRRKNGKRRDDSADDQDTHAEEHAEA